jgi:hypothetical protein
MVSRRPIPQRIQCTDSDLAVRSVQTNSIATRDPTTCRDMSACITLTRTETTLSCVWSWHSDPRAATEAGDAEQVANISATGRRKPRPGHLTPNSNLFISCTAVATGFSFLLAITKTFYEANELQLRASCGLSTMRYDSAVFRSFLQRYQGFKGKHTGSTWWYSYPLFFMWRYNASFT